jgi:hypothetical protein
MAEVATADISLLSKTIRSSMGEASGEFRKAAANSNVMSKVVKDISNIFNAQRKDIAELSNIMSENAYEAEQASSKIDNLSSLFREMISIQASTQGTMREVSFGIKNLNDQMYNLINSNSTIGTGITGLGSVFNTVGDTIVNTLKTLTLGAAAATLGAAGAAGVSAMMGGSGGGGGSLGRQDVKEGGGSGYEQSGLNRQTVADMIRKSAIQRGIDPETAVAIAKSEGLNTYRSSAPGKKWGMDREPSYGPFQLLVGRGTGGPEGLGDRFKAATGIDPATDRSAASIQKQIDFALDEAKKKGWGQWYGRKTAGIGVYQGINVDTSKMKMPEVSTPQATQLPSSPATQDTSRSLNPESMAGHGHGPISGPMTGKDKVEGSSAIPSGDVIALGKYLQGQGLRISEHPAFGGVNPVHKGRAHYEGRAIDINVGRGVTEASDPVLGAKFDKLAEQLTRAGYKVYWRESGQFGASGHNNHLHAELPSGGGKSTPDTYQAGKSATDADMAKQGATPMSAPSPTTGMAAPPVSAPTPSTATPEAQAPVTTNPVTASLDASMAASLMGMMGGMGGIGAMGGMESMGAMVGAVAPMVATTLASSNIPEMQQTSPDNAELVQALSRSAMNNQMVSEAAVQQQAQQEAALETATTSQPNAMADNISPPVGSMGGGGEGYAYNYPGDNSWPDWASMIGGLHWSEMKNFKKNMWG